jgi:Transposase, Mutator family
VRVPRPRGQAALAEIWNAEDREHTEAAARSFVAEYGTRWPKAVAKIIDDLDVLESYNHPAEHWVHLRTTNRIESTFATVRLRQRVIKGPGSGAVGVAMAWRWRASSSSPPSSGGVLSTHPTWSLWSGPEPGSRRASWSNAPTNQEAISTSQDTPIRRS